MDIFQKINKFKSVQFSFGTTSAIITNIALIIGLDTATNSKLPIIGSLFVIALADNISDSLGIHMYQESEGMNQKQVWKLTITNFLSRFMTSLGFIALIFFLPLNIAVILSLVYGLAILTTVSYIIAVNRKMNPLHAISEHLLIAIVIIILSRLLGGAVLHTTR